MIQSIQIDRISVRLNNPPGNVVSLKEATEQMHDLFSSVIGNRLAGFATVGGNILGTKAKAGGVRANIKGSVQEIQDFVLSIESLPDKDDGITRWRIKLSGTIKMVGKRNQRVTRIKILSRKWVGEKFHPYSYTSEQIVFTCKNI